MFSFLAAVVLPSIVREVSEGTDREQTIKFENVFLHQWFHKILAFLRASSIAIANNR